MAPLQHVGLAERPAPIAALMGECIAQVSCSARHALAVTRLCGDKDARWNLPPGLVEEGGAEALLHMLCPITGELLRDPVRIEGCACKEALCQGPFEREAIEAWIDMERSRLAGNGCSPALAVGPGPVCPLRRAAAAPQS